MSGFYQNLQRQNVLTALRESQINMIKKSPQTGEVNFNHPYFWSGFVVIGNSLSVNNIRLISVRFYPETWKLCLNYEFRYFDLILCRSLKCLCKYSLMTINKYPFYQSIIRIPYPIANIAARLLPWQIKHPVGRW